MKTVRKKNGITEAAALHLKEKVHEFVELPQLLMFSGGSSFKVLEEVKGIHFSPLTVMTVLDERYTFNKKESNFANLMHTDFAQDAVRQGVHFIDPRADRGDSLEDTAARFEVALRRWRAQYPNGKVLITQGVSEDGHTAGILPCPGKSKMFSSLFEETSKWVVGYRADPHTYLKLNERLTVTFPFLKQEVDMALVYMVGESKKAALEALLSESGNVCESPARVLHEMRDVTLFTDIDAAT